MNFGFIKRMSLGATAASLLVACGGGSGPLAGISGTGVTSEGAVTAFGSVFVNGVEFDTNNANIIVNGEPATQADLHVGQVVTVTGTLDDETRGTAETVIFDRLLDGPVENIDRQGRIITALGQTVRIGNTAFIDVTPGDLAELNLIAVSGFVNDRGEIVATTLQRAEQNFTFGTRTDVEGVVSRLTPTRFNIGRLRVDYGNARLNETAGALENGAAIEVFGTQTTRGGIFSASTVRVVDRTLGAPGRRVELEGIVADFNGLGDFTISGQPVDASGAAQADNTGLALGANVRVEVEGEIDPNGVLIAESFAIRPSSNIRFTAAIDSVHAARDSLKIFGLPVESKPTTRYQDNSAAHERALRLDELRFADYVEVQAFHSATGKLIATGVTRTGFNAQAKVRGPAALTDCDPNAGTLSVAGFRIRADTATFTLHDGARTNFGAFCASLGEGDRIEATGTQNGDELLATKIGLVD